MPNAYKVGKLKTQKSIKTVRKGANTYRMSGKMKKTARQTAKTQKPLKGSLVKKSLNRAAERVFGW